MSKIKSYIDSLSPLDKLSIYMDYFIANSNGDFYVVIKEGAHWRTGWGSFDKETANLAYHYYRDEKKMGFEDFCSSKNGIEYWGEKSAGYDYIAPKPKRERIDIDLEISLLEQKSYKKQSAPKSVAKKSKITIDGVESEMYYAEGCLEKYGSVHKGKDLAFESLREGENLSVARKPHRRTGCEGGIVMPLAYLGNISTKNGERYALYKK